MSCNKDGLRMTSGRSCTHIPNTVKMRDVMPGLFSNEYLTNVLVTWLEFQIYFVPGKTKLQETPLAGGHNECESSKINPSSVAFLGSFITPGTK
jgi:hypothetical protein